jgi:dTDP-4-dehydrorhamnose 3,5-epimerase
MRALPTRLPGVLILEPTVHGDARGFFYESFNARTFAAATGVDPVFVQDNHSRSARNVVRGLHYQLQQPQGKLVRAVAGEVYDVAVDIRSSSATFGSWVAVRLSADNYRQLWIPPGFAHGFVAVSDSADVVYKATDYWAPQHERIIRWNDPAIGIEWPLTAEPVLASKDLAGLSLAAAECPP